MKGGGASGSPPLHPCVWGNFNDCVSVDVTVNASVNVCVNVCVNVFVDPSTPWGPWEFPIDWALQAKGVVIKSGRALYHRQLIYAHCYCPHIHPQRTHARAFRCINT